MNERKIEGLYTDLHKRLEDIFRSIEELDPDVLYFSLISPGYNLPLNPNYPDHMTGPKDVARALIYCKAAYTRYQKTSFDSAYLDWEMAKNEHPEAAKLISSDRT